LFGKLSFQDRAVLMSQESFSFSPLVSLRKFPIKTKNPAFSQELVRYSGLF